MTRRFRFLLCAALLPLLGAWTWGQRQGYVNEYVPESTPVFSPIQREMLVRQLKGLAQDKKFEVIVVVGADADIKKSADLARRWRVGSADRGFAGGMLIAVAVDTKAIIIPPLPGRPDNSAMAEAVMGRMRPQLANGNIGAGVTNGVRAVVSMIAPTAMARNVAPRSAVPVMGKQGTTNDLEAAEYAPNGAAVWPEGRRLAKPPQVPAPAVRPATPPAAPRRAPAAPAVTKPAAVAAPAVTAAPAAVPVAAAPVATPIVPSERRKAAGVIIVVMLGIAAVVLAVASVRRSRRTKSVPPRRTPRFVDEEERRRSLAAAPEKRKDLQIVPDVPSLEQPLPPPPAAGNPGFDQQDLRWFQGERMGPAFPSAQPAAAPPLDPGTGATVILSASLADEISSPLRNGASAPPSWETGATMLLPAADSTGKK
jgi:hypothetical protein